MAPWCSSRRSTVVLCVRLYGLESDFIHGVPSVHLHTVGTEVEMWDCLGKCNNTAFADWVTLWNHWGYRCTVECCTAREVMDSPLVRSNEVVNYEQWLIEFIAWMHGRRNSLNNKTHLHGGLMHLMWPCLPFRFSWILTRDCDSEMHMISNLQWPTTFVEYHRINTFGLLPGSCPRIYLPGPCRWFGWEPRR